MANGNQSTDNANGAIVYEPRALVVHPPLGAEYVAAGDIIKPMVRLEEAHMWAGVQHLMEVHRNLESIEAAQRMLALRGYCWDGMNTEWVDAERKLIEAMEAVQPMYKYPICTQCHGVQGVVPPCACPECAARRRTANTPS